MKTSVLREVIQLILKKKRCTILIHKRCMAGIDRITARKHARYEKIISPFDIKIHAALILGIIN